MQTAPTQKNEPFSLKSHLAEEIERVMSSGGASADDRLIPMRNISALCGVPMAVVRSAIELLVEKQLLVKRHGSGVYVRKIPAGVDPHTAANRLIPASLRLFVKAPQVEGRLRPKPRQTSLRLSIWWHDPKLNPTDKAFFDGAAEQAEKMGHQLEINVSRKKSGILADFSEYLRMVHAGKAHDGMIIIAKFAETYFAEPLDVRTPVVFAWLGSSEPFPAVIQPLVTLDLRSAHRKALAILASEGCRRIGLLGLEERESEFNPMLYQLDHLERDHKLFLDRLGLASDGLAQISPVDPDSVQKALRRLLDAQPDGVYVADDQVLANAAPAFKKSGITPGKDLPLITLSSDAFSLPHGFEWSRMEFNISQLGRLAVQSLVHTIQSSRMDLLSSTHQPQWIPGHTHLNLSKQ